MTIVKNRLLRIVEKVSTVSILILAGMPLFVFTSNIIIERAYIPQSAQEICILEPQGYLFYLLMPISMLFLLLLHKYFLRVNSRVLFFCLSGLYIVAGMYLILNAPPQIRADAGAVYQFASEFNHGDYSGLLIGSYLARYPHQLGLVTFERILMLFNSSTRFMFTAYLFMILVINYMQWKISEILSMRNTAVANLTLLFSFAFLPQLFFILFLYGLIPGLCCMISSVYFMLRYFQERSTKYCVFCIILMIISCTLRNNYIIGAIAMMILYLLDFLHNRVKSSVLIALVVVTCTMLFPKALIIGYEFESGTTIESATPKLLWVTMGLQENNDRTGGWYNGYTWDIPSEYNFDKERVEERALTDLLERLEYFKKNRDEAFHFFENKVKSTWLDPLFQSIWSGPLEDCNQTMRTKPLYDLYTGQGAYRIVIEFADILLALIYFMSLLYIVIKLLIHHGNIVYYELFPYIYILGGFLFHLIWETKSQYVYPYVYMLIPMVALCFNTINDLFKENNTRGRFESTD